MAGRRWTVLLAAAMCGLLISCGGSEVKQAQAGSGTGTVTMWAHDGTPAENASIQQAVTDFNNQNNGVTVNLTLVPSATYTQTVTNTGVNSLPDLLEFDGPTMAGFVFAEKLSPVTDFVSTATVANQTDSVTAQN